MSRIYYAPHRFFPLAVHKTKRHLPFRVSVWFLRTTIDTNQKELVKYELLVEFKYRVCKSEIIFG